MRKQDIRRYSSSELEADILHGWIDGAVAVTPRAKKLLSVRLDNEVVDWFRAQGRGYQTRMNAVLLAYVRHQLAAKKTG